MEVGSREGPQLERGSGQMLAPTLLQMGVSGRWGCRAGWGEQSSCPELGDRKGLRAKQEKTKFPFPWFPGLVPAVGEEAGWGYGFLSPTSSLGLPFPQTQAAHLRLMPSPQSLISSHLLLSCSSGSQT